MNTPIEKVEAQSSDHVSDANRVIVEVDGEEADAKKSAPPALVDINTEPYNHQKQQEIARKNIAYWLVGLVASITIFSFVYLWSLPLEVSSTKEYVANLILILQIIFGPIITLAGTAIGYYFGVNSK
jgi:hypothetical protein